MEQWRPLWARQSEEAATIHDTPVEGIPDHLEDSAYEWTLGYLASKRAALRMLERVTRKSIVGDNISAHWGVSDDFDKLEILDFLLHAMEEESNDGTPNDKYANIVRAAELKTMLAEAGSVWTVTIVPRWALVRRVSDAEQRRTEFVVSSGTAAAQEIGKAWLSCYGTTPNFEDSYRHAVLAVESAAVPLFIPNDPAPSLGKAISHLANTTANWTVGDLDAPRISSADTLLSMMRLVWHNHERHVGQGGAPPTPTGQDEAQIALSVAVTLVQWFNAGLVRKV